MMHLFPPTEVELGITISSLLELWRPCLTEQFLFHIEKHMFPVMFVSGLFECQVSNIACFLGFHYLEKYIS